MKKTIVLLGLFTLLANYSPAQHAQKNISGNYSKETECLGVEMDGSQTLKAWGFGNGKNDAIEQAKKNGVRDVLFKGIRSGKDECNQKPLINEVNAQDKYEDYFNKFFADAGAYTKFVNMKDEPIKIGAKDRKSATEGTQYGIVVRILRAELKKQMITDNILKQQ
jgi:hypothetical protein